MITMVAKYSGQKPPEPRTHRVQAAGAEICVFEWGRQTPGTPDLLLAHATGFHARCWDQVVHHLGQQHVFAVDLRGHGRSQKTLIQNWEIFGQDLIQLIEKLELRDIIGVGHSMGGHAMTDAAATLGERFQRLVLIDPVIGPPDAYEGVDRTRWDEPHPTARRKNRFDSAQAMLARFRQRPPYTDFHPDVLDDYCRFGLMPNPDGPGFVLACPPSIEASVYASSLSNAAVHQSIAAACLPVLVVRAKEPQPDRQIMDFSSSPTWPGLAATFPQGKELYLPERTHFIPLETPEYTADLILNHG